MFIFYKIYCTIQRHQEFFISELYWKFYWNETESITCPPARLYPTVQF